MTVLLDCTMRDGGYYNHWDFDSTIVASYLESMGRSGVDVVELGYRAIRNNDWTGYLFYCPEDYLRRFEDRKQSKFAVMIDAGDVLKFGQEKALQYYGPASNSLVDIVRVAAHQHEVEAIAPFLYELKKAGYDVCFNLMRFAAYTEAETEHALSMPAFREAVDVLYFADSYGSMSPDDVEYYIGVIRKHYSGTIGFHAHNNQGQALANALVAMNHGVEWIDATITGMGRGAGNLCTEEILLQLEKRGEKYRAAPLFDLVHDYFSTLKKKMGWGSSLAYGIAASHGIHPTYIQRLYEEDYDSAQVMACLDYLVENDGSKFSIEKLKSAQSNLGAARDVPSRRYAYSPQKEVLLVGASPTGEKYRAEIQELIKQKPNLFVISLNERGFDPELIDLYVSINKRRFNEAYPVYKENQHKVLVAKEAIVGRNDVDVFTEEMSYGVGRFAYEDTISIPDHDVFWFGLAVALRLNPEQIYLAGIEKPYRDESYGAILTQALRNVPCVSLGKTAFDIPTKSIVGVLSGL